MKDGPSSAPPDSLLPYDQWMEEALRGVVARALRHVIAEGLPGAHHYYITFRTDYPGVMIPPRLAQKYPQEMTIVLQHQFDNLMVDEAAGVFGVSLSFGGVLSALTIPLAAVTAFVDPHVQYGLRFKAAQPPAPPPALPTPTLPIPALPAPVVAGPAAAAGPRLVAAPSDGAEPQVVSLDAFRRKRD